MTKERAKELLPVIQAYADGATIERKGVWDNKWQVVKEPCFDNNSEYRIAEEVVEDIEKKYRPFTSCDELIEYFISHYNTKVPEYACPLIWVRTKGNHRRHLITMFDDWDDVYVSNDDFYNLAEVMEMFTFLDGKTIGVEE